MKRELLILTMAAGMVAALSASGKDDDQTDFYGRGPAMGRGYNYDSEAVQNFRDDRQAEMDQWIDDQETVSLTGKLTLVNGEMPAVESDGVTYTIMAPWYDLGDVELADGMEVTVEGIEMPGAPLRWDSNEKALMLTKALVNGKEIVIDHPADGAGFRGGMAGGMGPRNGGAFAMGGRGAGAMGRRF